MGKAGGFFKRLKKKEKEKTKKGSRGTTGMKKADRILKFNAMVDINATKRKINEMDAVSSSSGSDAEDDDNVSSASSDHIDFNALAASSSGGGRLLFGSAALSSGARSGAQQQKKPSAANSAAGLDKLRTLLGVANNNNTAGEAKKKSGRNDEDDLEEDEEDEFDDDDLMDIDADAGEDEVYDALGDAADDDEELDEEALVALAAEEAPEEEMEEGEEDEEEEEGGYMVPEENWDDLFKGIEGATGAAAVSSKKTTTKQKDISTSKVAADLKGKRGRGGDDDDDGYDGEDADVGDDDAAFDEEDEYNSSDDNNDSSSQEDGDGDADGGKEGDDGKDDSAQARNVEALLPAFTLSEAEMNEIKKIDATALGEKIVERDPWYARYYAPSTSNSAATATATAAAANSKKKDNKGAPPQLPPPIAVLAAEERPALQPASGVLSWEEPTLNPKLDAVIAARATPNAAAIVAALASDEKKGASSAPSSSSSNAKATEGDGTRPAFIHDIAWDLWCHYRAKLKYQKSLAAKKAAAAAAEKAGEAALNNNNNDTNNNNVAVSASYRSAMTKAEIAAAGLLAPHEVAYFRLLQSYGDLLDTSKAWDNTFSRRELLALHLVNHWLKTKTLVTAHNEVLNRRRKARRERIAAKKKALLAERAKQEAAAAAAEGTAKKGGANPKQKGIYVYVSDDEDDDAVEFRDQNFGKTRMMVMLPMRNVALEYVEAILRLLYAKEADDDHISAVLAHTMGAEAAWHVDNDPYRLHRKATQGPNAGMDVATRCEYYTNSKHVRKLDVFRGDFSEIEESLTLRTFRKRPEEFRQVFYGNMDDCFCFGMSLGLPPSATADDDDGDDAGSKKKKKSSGTQYTSMYSHVLNSDLIICSPLGLRKRLGKSGDVVVSLSSVEVCVVDCADVLVMQNWEHLQEVVKLLNERPRETTEGLGQISRLFEWVMRSAVTKANPMPVTAAGRRQNIVLSSLSHSSVQSTFRAMGCYDVEDTTAALPANARDNEVEYATFFKASSFYVAPAKHQGVIAKVPIPVRQHFLRFNASSIAAADDERFAYFTQQLYPSRIQSLIDREVRTILFVPSYFDFVRLRNHFFTEQRDLTAFLSEYSTEKQQRQVLGQFTDMERPFLIMTERFYFFKRYFVRLAEQLIFYSPPVHKEYYSTLIGKLNADSPNASVMTIYSKYDTHELVRISGTDRAKALLERPADTFAFVTNGGIM